MKLPKFPENPDKYDLEIDRLTSIYLTNRNKLGRIFETCVVHSWSMVEGRANSCLFAFCTPTGLLESLPADQSCYAPCSAVCGCLSQVHSSHFEAWTPELTERIRADDRLISPFALTHPSQLLPYAEWQREMDNTLRKDVTTTAQTN